MLNFRVFDSLTDLVEGAAEEVVWTAEHNPRAVVALSGGSTPKPLYELLATKYRDRLANRRIVWMMGDERCVPPDHPQSNARMITATLFPHGIAEKHSFLKFDTTATNIAASFSEQWRALEIHEIDLAILGMGEDGHTASLFPGTTILEVTDRIAAEVDVPQLGSRRVSVTMPHLRGARRKIVLVTGSGKRETIRRISEGEPLPMTEIVGGGGETWWFVDREAYPG